MTNEQVQAEMVQGVFGGHIRVTAELEKDKQPTAKSVRTHADRWKSLIAGAEEAYEKLVVSKHAPEQPFCNFEFLERIVLA